tara:strand:- start:8718 stop:9941 length:1224 start_codon:yes stop_codon:yes gene_type:complete
MLIFKLSKQFLRASNQSGFVRLTVWLAILGIILGVMTLNAVSSVMNGFQEEVRNKLFGIAEHVVVRYYEPDSEDKDKEFLGRIDNIEYASPFLMNAGILKSKRQAAPVFILGIDPNKVNYDHMLSDTTALDELSPNSFNILTGRQIAASLFLKNNSHIYLLTAPRPDQLLMDVNLKRVHFTQGVNFKVGKRLEERMAFMHITDLQKIAALEGKISGYNIHLKDLYDAPLLKSQIQEHMGERAYVSDWTEQYSELFTALRLQKSVMIVLLALIVIIALFNLTTGQVMLVNERKSSIAVLMTCGISPIQLTGIFLLQGLMIAGVGIVIGTLLGYWVSSHIGDWVKYFEHIYQIQLISQKVYMLDYLPHRYCFIDSIYIALWTLLLTLLSCLYPAYLANQTHPAKVLRYE